jgi:hypothetical protein
MDSKYVSYLHGLGCCVCSAEPPSEVNHDRRKGTGLSLRSPDIRGMPFCRKCHRDYHQYRGFFGTLTYEQRCAWADETITMLQEGYRRLYGDEAELRERIDGCD